MNSAFSSFGFKYEIVYGQVKYASECDGGPFDLSRWVHGINQGNFINCYDQGSIVQIALGLGPPVTTEWMYMKPYGFIQPTNIVGYPLNPNGPLGKNCNNPIGASPATLVVDNDASTRKPFGNHVFIRVGGENGFIADACAGPHLGTETLQQYIDAAIQKLPNHSLTEYQITTLYSSQAEGKKVPGTVHNAKVYTGVTCLDGCYIRGPNHDRPETDGSKRAMVKAREGMTTDNTVYAINLDSLKDQFKAHEDKYFNLLLNEQGCTATWDMHFDSPTIEDTEIQISILESNARALKFFENDLHTSEIPAYKYLTKPASIPLASQLFLATDDSTALEDGVSGVLLWVRGNVCVSIIGNPSAVELWESWGSKIDAFLKECSTLAPGDLKDFAYDIPQTAVANSDMTITITVSSLRRWQSPFPQMLNKHSPSSHARSTLSCTTSGRPRRHFKP